MKYVSTSIKTAIGLFLGGVVCSLSVGLTTSGHSHLGLAHFITWNAKALVSEGIDTFARDISLAVKPCKRYCPESPHSQAFFSTGDAESMEEEDVEMLNLSMKNGALVLLIREGVIVAPEVRLDEPLDQVEFYSVIEHDILAAKARNRDHLVFLHPLEGENMSSLRLQDVADFVSNTQVTTTSLRSFLQSLGSVAERLAVVYAEVVSSEADALPTPQGIKALNLNSREGQLQQWKGRCGMARKMERELHKETRAERIERRTEYLANTSASSDSKNKLQRAQDSYRRKQKATRREGRWIKNQDSYMDVEVESDTQ